VENRCWIISLFVRITILFRGGLGPGYVPVRLCSAVTVWSVSAGDGQDLVCDYWDVGSLRSIQEKHASRTEITLRRGL
jgi:hypothetical protein